MPTEVKFRPYKDISLSFKRHPVTNDIFSINGKDVIKRSVINLVRTKVGERFFASILGTNVENLLFNLDTFAIQSNIDTQIKNVLENFEPRVKLNNVSVRIDGQEVYVTIDYNIVGQESDPQPAIDILLFTR